MFCVVNFRSFTWLYKHFNYEKNSDLCQYSILNMFDFLHVAPDQ